MVVKGGTAVKEAEMSLFFQFYASKLTRKAVGKNLFVQVLVLVLIHAFFNRIPELRTSNSYPLQV